MNLQLEIQSQNRCRHRPLYWSGHILVSNVALVPVILPQLMPHTREMLENETNRKKKTTHFRKSLASIHIRICADMEKNYLPGWVASSHIWLTEVGVSSSGACNTMIVDPTMQSKQPNTPILCSFSFKIKWANTALTQVDKTKTNHNTNPTKKKC